MKKIAMLAVATALATGAAHAQTTTPSGNTDTDQGAATATVVAPITLTHDDGAVLSFGTFTVGTGGTITVAADTGEGTFDGDVGEVTGSSTSADSFTVTGDPDRGFDIVTEAGEVSNGTHTMEFSTTPSATTGELDGQGSASFTVGGVLTVTGSESAGVYNGEYDATVTYN